MLAITLIAAIILLVLDINNVVHLSYWVIALIGVSPIILSIVLLILAGILGGLAVVFGGTQSRKRK